jgi:hypothetical protein
MLYFYPDFTPTHYSDVSDADQMSADQLLLKLWEFSNFLCVFTVNTEAVPVKLILTVVK